MRQLQANTVHIWILSLEIDTNLERTFYEQMSLDEKNRANQYCFPQLRSHAIAARGYLRTLLAQYLSVPANSIRFEYGKHGKPCLPNGFSPLAFNLSHSESWCCYAFTKHRSEHQHEDISVGIDIEYKKRLDEMQSMKNMLLTEEEIAAFKRLNSAQQHEYFYRKWVYKEALVKALGLGFSYPLNECTLLKAGHSKYHASTHTAPPASKRTWEISPLIDGFLPHNFDGAIALPIGEWLFDYYTAANLPLHA